MVSTALVTMETSHLACSRNYDNKFQFHVQSQTCQLQTNVCSSIHGLGDFGADHTSLGVNEVHRAGVVEGGGGRILVAQG